jgi:hypothetical protein
LFFMPDRNCRGSKALLAIELRPHLIFGLQLRFRTEPKAMPSRDTRAKNGLLDMSEQQNTACKEASNGYAGLATWSDRLLRKQTPNGDAGSTAQTPNGDTPISHAANPPPPCREPPTAGGPISYLSNKDSLAHVRARARGGDADQWQAVRQRLVQALGREAFDSWFGKVTLTRIEAGVAQLRAPTRFAAKWLSEHYEAQTIEAWRAEAPGLVGVQFDHRAGPPADAQLASEQPAVQR